MNTAPLSKTSLRRSKKDESVTSNTVKIPVSPLTKAWLIKNYGKEPIRCIDPLLQSLMELSVERVPATRAVQLSERMKVVCVEFEKPAKIKGFPVLKRHLFPIGKLLDCVANLAHTNFMLGAAIFTKPGTAATTYRNVNDFDELHDYNLQKMSMRTYKKFVSNDNEARVEQALDEDH
ncbi:hypothetical protein [Siphonobacter sp. SORGH_AS_0500]|uniref:hypothetical protein n=1 Tax=Siphonobacter sp. SORGH_AS_0500 TaxID=1864824 RepID=UPI002863222C|nr:hypothetical protein [Siphonobacter sp. SORGH_AS_0500]MDR6196170.1 hypothetical protein [Siphonobacter sp. SORGH_AS_0500]